MEICRCLSIFMVLFFFMRITDFFDPIYRCDKPTEYESSDDSIHFFYSFFCDVCGLDVRFFTEKHVKEWLIVTYVSVILTKEESA